MVQVSLTTSTTFEGDLNALIEDQGTALTVRLDLDEPAPTGGLRIYLDSPVEQILNRLDLPGAVFNPRFENINPLTVNTNFDNSGIAITVNEGATFASFTLDIFNNPEPDTFLPETFDGLVEAEFSVLTADQVAAEDQSSIIDVSDYTVDASAASSTVLFADDASQLPGTPEPPEPPMPEPPTPPAPPTGEPPVVSFEVVPDSFSEEAENNLVEWRWTVTGDFPEDGIVVNLDTSGGGGAFAFTEQFAGDTPSEFVDAEIVDFDDTGRINILLSAPEASFRLFFADDLIEEGTQTFEFLLAEGEGYAVDSALNGGVFTITDDNGGPGVGPTVGLSVSETSLAEGDPLTVTFNVEGDIPEGGVQVLVQSDVPGVLGQFDLADLGNITTTGIEGLPSVGDGGGGSFIVTITEPTATISLNVFDDILAEEPLDVTFTVANGEEYEVSADAASATLTIADEPSEPGPTVGITLDQSDVVEGDSITLTFNVEGDIPEGGLTVLVNDADSAQNQLRSLTEFDIANIELSGIEGSPTPADGDSGFFVTLTEATASITLPVIDDGADEDEAEESFTFELIDGEAYQVAADAGSVTLNISDATDGGSGGGGDEPVVSFSTDITTLTESEGSVVTLSFTVEGDIPEGGLPISVGVDADDSAWFFDLDNASRPGINPDTGSFDSVAFLGGNVVGIDGGRVITRLMPPDFDQLDLVLTENTASFELEIFDDALAEMAETVALTLQDGEGYAIASDTAPITLTLQDSPDGIVDATSPVVGLTTDRTTVAEDETLTITLTVDGDIPEGGLEVFVDSDSAGALGEFAVTELETTGIEGTPGPNTDASGFIVTLVENEATITIPVFKDGLGEGEESFTFSVADGELYDPDPAASEVTLTIEETPPTVSVSLLGGTFEGEDLVTPNLVESGSGTPVLSVIVQSDAPVPEEGLVVSVNSDLADITEFLDGTNFVPTAFGGEVLGAIYDDNGVATGFQVRMTAPNTVVNFANGLGFDDEGAQEVSFSVEAGEGYIPAEAAASITVYDTVDQVPVPTSTPEIGISVEQERPLSEGRGAVTLDFNVTGDIPDEGVVVYVNTGEFAGLVDFDLLNAGVVGGPFPTPDGGAGGFYFRITEPTASITLQAQEDELVEGIEAVDLTLQPLAGYTIAEDAADVSVLVRDGRGSEIQVSLETEPATLIEAEGTVSTHTFSLSAPPPTEGITVSVDAPGLGEFDPDSLSITGATVAELRTDGFDLLITEQTAVVELAIADDGMAEGLETATFTLAEPGEDAGYQVDPEASSGSFTLVDTADQAPAAPIMDDGPNDTIATAIATGLSADNSAVTVEGSISGNFFDSDLSLRTDQTEDVDLYSFELAAGDTIRIDADADAFDSGLDPILRLFDADANQVAISDDDFAPDELFAPGRLDSYIEFTATDAGTYYVGISSFGNAPFDFFLDDDGNPTNAPYDPNVVGSGTGRSSGDYSLNLTLNEEFIPEATEIPASTGAGPTVSLAATPGTFDGDDSLLASALAQFVEDGNASILTLGLTAEGDIPEDGVEVFLTSNIDLSSVFSTGAPFSPGGAEVLGAVFDDSGASIGLRVNLLSNSAILNLNLDSPEMAPTDGEETVTFTLEPSAGYTVGEDSFSAVVYDTLEDVPALPDVPTVSISVSETALVESEGNTTTLTFSLDAPPPPEGVVINLDSGVRAALGEFDVFNAEITGGTFPSPNFQASGFFFQMTEQTATITLAAFDETANPTVSAEDALEGVDEFTFTVQPGVGYAIDSSANAVTVTIADNPDSMPLPDDGGDGDDGGDDIVTEAELNDTIATAIATGLSADNPVYEVSAEIGTTRETRNLVDRSEDVDMYAFELEAGQTLILDVDGGGTGDAGVEGSTLDSILRVFDAEGAELAISENDGAPDEVFQANGDAYLEFTATEAGTYYAGVSNLGNNFYDPNVLGSGSGWIFSPRFEPGPYRLEATLADSAPAMPGDAPEVSLSITPAQVIEGDSDAAFTATFTVDGEVPAVEFDADGNYVSGGLSVFLDVLEVAELGNQFEDFILDNLQFGPGVDSAPPSAFEFILFEETSSITLTIFDGVFEEEPFTFNFGLLEDQDGMDYTVNPDANTGSFELIDGIGGPGVGPNVGISLSETELEEGDSLTVNFTVDGEIPEGGLPVVVASPTPAALGEFAIFDENNSPLVALEGIAGLPESYDGQGSSFLVTLTEQNASLTLGVFEDGPTEGPETFTFEVLNGELYEPDPAASSVELTINDGGEDAAFAVESGVTSVFLDLPLLEEAAGLTLVSADSDAMPFSEDFQVGFAIAEETDFTFAPAPFTPLGGTIEHSGTITLGLGTAEATVGEFSIGFDASRVTDTASGFFVADTLDDPLGLEVLFDLSAPGTASVMNEELEISGADLLVSPELAGALGMADLAGADVGDARIDAMVMATGGEPAPDTMGTDGDDMLVGSSAADVLNGMGGDDMYTGGAGADSFVFSIAQGVDTITDFEVGSDRIELSGLTAEGVRTLEVASDTMVLTNSNQLIGVVQGVAGLDNAVFV